MEKIMDNCPLIHSDHLIMDSGLYSRLRPDNNNRAFAPLNQQQQPRKSPRITSDSSRLTQLDTNNRNDNYSRISLFRALTSRRRAHNKNNGSKHKKLCEDWLNGNNEDPLLHGVTFHVKFLGSALTDKAGSNDASEATRTVIHMVKAGKKSCRVAMTVSPSGVMMVDEASGEVISEISIYDIAHCSMDGTYPTIFSFIATNKNDTNECYCFACDKRKMAQKATLTIADAFQLAYDIWRNSSSTKISQSPQLIEKSSSTCSSASSSASWVNFDEGRPQDTQLKKLDQVDEDDDDDDDDDEHLLICFH